MTDKYPTPDELLPLTGDTPIVTDKPTRELTIVFEVTKEKGDELVAIMSRLQCYVGHVEHPAVDPKQEERRVERFGQDQATQHAQESKHEAVQQAIHPVHTQDKAQGHVHADDLADDLAQVHVHDKGHVRDQGQGRVPKRDDDEDHF
ncbi:hypothetical protein PSEUBRA_003117 [Kalmanozyma brasiliensis GHG001]|uniref:uncharacterized protein n=1 Tax=Kalmanozyma brasiliensis (strain GHG001) TaxID=1365824 RepID=UPI001CE9036F|nr:uncharacterized protein PSEUBRA_003117 [Kalmanozyma brasiliensis GHG001]KAF6767190.1 hypothetical protein PSEUBRA_003117 [Kalmanozyma brasiliensis GHG001]